MVSEGITKLWVTSHEGRGCGKFVFVPFPSLPRQDMLRHALRGYIAIASGVEVFLAGVRPDSPARSDTFLPLRVTARLSRGCRVGSYVVRQARAPTIRASFLGSSGRAARSIISGMFVRGGRRPHRPNLQLLRRQEAGFDDEGGGGQSVDERGRDGLNLPCARIFVFSDQNLKREEHCVFGTVERGNQL